MSKTLILSLFVVLSVFIGTSQQRGYDANLAYRMLRASSASYCGSDSLTNMKCGEVCNNLPGYRFIKQYAYKASGVESVSYSLFVNTNEKKYVVSFRGTTSATQLMKEFVQGSATSFTIHYVKNAVATKYFYNNYVGHLRGDVLNALRDASHQYPDYSFYITGHSLGGAFATLAAFDISMSHIVDKDRIHLYTFGSPRVGDYNLAQAIVNNVGEIYRVTHNRDIVPHLPPCIPNILNGGCTQWANHPNQNNFLIFNAYHVWPEVYYYDNNNYKICYSGEDTGCSNQAMVPLSIPDHLKYLGVSTQCLNFKALI